jgi:hypothetical protein
VYWHVAHTACGNRTRVQPKNVWRVLFTLGHRVVEALEGMFNVSGHWYVDKVMVIIPHECQSNELAFAGPIGHTYVGLFEGSN